MNPSDEQKGAGAPGTGGTPPAEEPSTVTPQYEDGFPHEPEIAAPAPSAPSVKVSRPAPPPPAEAIKPTSILSRLGGGGSTPPPPSGGDGDDGDGEDDYMLRMSFLEHLAERRSRLIKALLRVPVPSVGIIIF